MDTTLNPKQTDPRHVLVARAEEEFAHVYVAAIVWQSSYGDAAKQIIARWAPQLVPTSSLPLENPGLSGQPS